MSEVHLGKTSAGCPELWILGGYGDVGLRVARYLQLLLDKPGIVLVGRSREKLRSATHIISGARSRTANVAAAGVLDGAPKDAIIINCVESFPAELAAKHVSHGGTFIDMSADPDYVDKLRNAFAREAHPTGVAIIEAGLAPGLTGILANHVADQDARTEQIDVVLELGTGRHHGRGATAWTIAGIAGDYRVKTDGDWTTVLPGQLRRKIRFTDRSRDVLAIGFGFSDQQSIARELHLNSCRTFLALDPPWMTRALAFLAGSCFARRVLPARAGKIARALELFPSFGGTGTRLLVEGADISGQRTAAVEMRSGDQADLTALVIAATARAVLTADVEGLTPLGRILDAKTAADLIAEWIPGSHFRGL